MTFYTLYLVLVLLLYTYFTKNQKVWLCGQGRPDSSFVFKSCEIDKSQGRLV